MRRHQSGEADGVPHQYGKSRRLSRGSKPVLCVGHATGSARGDAGRGIETIRGGIHDRDRSHRGGVTLLTADAAYGLLASVVAIHIPANMPTSPTRRLAVIGSPTR